MQNLQVRIAKLNKKIEMVKSAKTTNAIIDEIEKERSVRAVDSTEFVTDNITSIYNFSNNFMDAGGYGDSFIDSNTSDYGISPLSEPIPLTFEEGLQEHTPDGLSLGNKTLHSDNNLRMNSCTEVQEGASLDQDIIVPKDDSKHEDVEEFVSRTTIRPKKRKRNSGNEAYISRTSKLRRISEPESPIDEHEEAKKYLQQLRLQQKNMLPVNCSSSFTSTIQYEDEEQMEQEIIQNLRYCIGCKTMSLKVMCRLAYALEQYREVWLEKNEETINRKWFDKLGEEEVKMTGVVNLLNAQKVNRLLNLNKLVLRYPKLADSGAGWTTLVEKKTKIELFLESNAEEAQQWWY